jgi:ParB family chromosome partitioning protein
MRRAISKGIVQLMETPGGVEPQSVALDEIAPNPRQPRTHFNEDGLAELAASIRSKGILQPLIVRRNEEGRIELVAGERRLRAAAIALLESVPVTFVDVDDRGAAEIAIIENVQRENITPVEAARAYRRLIDEYRLTQEQVADKVGKSRVAVANVVRLLRLPQTILASLESGQLSEGHARALLQIEDEAVQLAVFQRLLDKGLTVRDVESLARTSGRPSRKTAKKSSPEPDAAWSSLEEGLGTFLGAPVKLQKSEVGGRISIQFFSDDDLERILEILGIRL